MAQCSERNNSHLKQANAITTRSGKKCRYSNGDLGA